MKSKTQQEQNNQEAGAQNQGLPAFVAIGKFRRPHGVRGEIVMEILTQFPERIIPGLSVYVGKRYVEHQVTKVRAIHEALLISLKGYADRDLAGEFRNQYVYMRIEDLPELPEEEFYLFELVGLRVTTEAGVEVGIVEEVMETKANDVYVIRKDDGSELLLPAIESVILDINFDDEVIVVVLPEWDN